MSWFKKKENPKTEFEEIITSIAPKECQHLWWDSSPYFEFNWTSYCNDYNRRRDKKEQLGRLRVEITEAYVCCNCGERHNETLQKVEIDDITRDQALEEISKIKEEYKDFCKSRAKVEDEICDLKYKIDRQLLQTIAVYQPKKVGSVLNTDIPILEKFLNGE